MPTSFKSIRRISRKLTSLSMEDGIVPSTVAPPRAKIFVTLPYVGDSNPKSQVIPSKLHQSGGTPAVGVKGVLVLHPIIVGFMRHVSLNKVEKIQFNVIS